jgi:four helix bundle protein
MTIMELENLEIYQISMTISGKIWELSNTWNHFEKDTIGKQIVRASDSISANISEGFGRYHYNDSKNFLFYARGSLYETLTWLKKARDRNLIKNEDFEELERQCIRLTVKLNNFIKSIGKHINS